MKGLIYIQFIFILSLRLHLDCSGDVVTATARMFGMVCAWWSVLGGLLLKCIPTDYWLHDVLKCNL